MFGKKPLSQYQRACMIEKGEIVCCNVFGEWSHFRCLGMKEGVGVLKGKLLASSLFLGG